MPYITETEYSKMIGDVVMSQKGEDTLRANNEQLRQALIKAMLWTDEEYDVSDWRAMAKEALK